MLNIKKNKMKIDSDPKIQTYIFKKTEWKMKPL